MPPQLVRKEINLSFEAFEEMTNALNEAGIKLEKDDVLTINKDISVKGPILYRQVNLRHQILAEVVKIYKAPMNEHEIEVTDSNHFINFLDDVYKYCLTGERPATTQPKASLGWGKDKK